MTDRAVHLSDVRYRWHSGEPLVLDIPHFDLAEKERLFVKGPSGSGKTTLLNILGGVAVPEAGKVEVLGRDIANLSGAARDAFRADHIGFIFQMFNLVPYLSLVENVVLPCRFSSARRRRIEARGSTPEREAYRLLNHMELNPDRLNGRDVAKLSVGQQQRVAVARALVGGPGLVIADEPTSALDADARNLFLDLLIKELEEAGAALLFVSHDAALAEAFDRTLEIGQINRAGEAT